MASDIPPSYFGKPRSVVSAEIKPTEEVECPLCHLSPKPFAVDYQGFQLCRCQNCGLEFISPRPTFKQLAERVYTDSYFPKYDDATECNEAASYYFARHLSRYESILGRKGKILDIGCGNGAFLRYAQKQGWKICAADIILSSDARRLKCPRWEDRFQEIDFGDIRFDVIRFNHVLEHTQNPLEELKCSRELIEPQGIIHVSVPNIAGLSPRLKSFQSRLSLKRRRWRHYAAMHHLFFFSPRTLRLVIEDAGLRVLHWETPVPKKDGQHPLVEGVCRHVLERLHNASILDFYCTLN